MRQKTEHIIFFTTLIAIGLLVAGGVIYFKIQEAPASYPVHPTSTIAIEEPTGTIPNTILVLPAPSSTKAVPALTLPYTMGKLSSNETYWPKAWGNVSFTNNTLALIPDPSTHGANSFLNGAASWTNYAATADTTWLMGGWFDIIARVASNTQDFVYCEFGSNGTEIVQRVNGNDTQLASANASSSAGESGLNNFGIKVYGNDVGCTIDGSEVVGAHVTANESPKGGIGFVIFGQPAQQKKVTVSKIRVTKLANNTITVPFPVPVITPPAPVVITPPPVIVSPQPPVQTPQPPVVVTTPATTTKMLPYSTNIFSKSQGWNTWWGNFTLSTDSLDIAASKSIPAGGVLLDGSQAWENYTFTANLDWVKGQTFSLLARYTNAQNYVFCNYTEPYLGKIEIRLEQYVNGTDYVLVEGDVNDYNQWGGANITAYIQLRDNQALCSFNNHVISNADQNIVLNPPFTGRIGFSSSDPRNNNSEIVVHSISVESLQ